MPGKRQSKRETGVKQALEYTWNEEVKTPNATVMGFYSDKGINMENTEQRLFI